MQPGQLCQLLQLCLGGRQSCKPTGASAAAKLLLARQKSPRGWTDSIPLLSHSHAFSHSVSCARSRTVSLWSFFPSLFRSSLTSVFFFFSSCLFLSNTRRILSSLSLSFWFIHYRTRMFYSFCLQPWFPLLTNCRPVASQQFSSSLLSWPISAPLSSLQYVSHKVICHYKQWWAIWVLLRHS